jgi:putative methionine-R-sulfoxide reductase with GAF domain
MQNVRSILSSNGEKGVIRSALALRSSIILNDVTRDPRYVAADEYSFSEVCLVEALCSKASIALNVESCTPGAFSVGEIDFLTSVADNFGMVIFQNVPHLFNLQSSDGQSRLTLH